MTSLTWQSWWSNECECLNEYQVNLPRVRTAICQPTYRVTPIHSDDDDSDDDDDDDDSADDEDDSDDGVRTEYLRNEYL